MKDFKLCKTCKTPSACKSAGKCMGGKSGYSKGGMAKMGYKKGGMVACGASNPPAQKRSK